MKILFLTNNDITAPLSEWLKVHTKEEVVKFSEKTTSSHVKAFCPDYVISYNYKHIIGKDVIELVSGRIINLHTSLLPWNKGADPNLWSFIEDTPKGVTIHHIDSGIDTGEILFQKGVFFDEKSETLRSSYKVLHDEIQKLFISNWDDIKNSKIAAKAQKGEGSFHYSKEASAIKEAFGEGLWSEPIYLLKQKVKEMSLL